MLCSPGEKIIIKFYPKKVWVESKIDLPLYQPKKLILWATHIIGTTQVNQQTKTT